MGIFFFFMACGTHRAPQKNSVDALPEKSSATASLSTGLHNGVFTGYDPQGVLGEMKENCGRCRRGRSSAEQSFLDQCTQAGGEFFTCGCIDMLCSVQIAPQ